MVPVVHKHGKSFKGLAAYLLHDQGTKESSERVAWTHTHNLSTENAELAWRIQAATAIDATALKQASGQKATGSKLKSPVLHYSLSWHAEERENLSREEMLQAALASLSYLGTEEGETLGKNKKCGTMIKAQRTQKGHEHQAVIICHDEGEGSKPHVHIMVNRVHPETGLVLSDSMDYEKLSDWALDYRTSQGKERTYCPQRVQNAALRARGFRTHNKRVPRNVYEQEKTLHDRKLSKQQAAELMKRRQKAAKVKEAQDKRKAALRLEIESKEKAFLEAKAKEQELRKEQLANVSAKAKQAHKEKLVSILDRQRGELTAFEESQSSLKGRVKSSFAAISSKRWMNEIRSNPINAVTNAVKLAVSSGYQKKQIEELHQKELDALQTQMRKSLLAASETAREASEKRQRDQEKKYEQERSEAILKQKMDRAKANAEWHELRKDRKPLERSLPRSKQDQRITEPFNRAASPDQSQQAKGEGGESPDARTQAEIEREEFLEAFKESVLEDLREEDLDQDLDHDIDR